MFVIDDITGKNAKRINNFSFSQETGTTHVILSPSVNFLNEFQNVLWKKEPLRSGSVTIDGADIASREMRKQCHFITNRNLLYPDLSVIENIFPRRNFSNIRGKRCKKDFDELLRKTGFTIKPEAEIKALTIEEQKITEILRSYYAVPKLLIVREISGIISFNTFMRFIEALKTLNEKGTTCLYLTNQWEEAVKVNSDITIVVNGKNQGTYSADDVRSNPNELCYLSMGAKRYLDKKEERSSGDKSLLVDLNLTAKKAASSYNIKNTIQMFSQYLIKELDASTSVTYLVDNRKNRIVDIVSHNDESKKAEAEGTSPYLKNEIIEHLLDKGGFGYFSKDELFFASSFTETPNVDSVICYAFEINDDLSVLMQINYIDGHIYTERDMLVIEWAAREMAIFIENSHLMGKSVLLQESYHRIKNNLQVIVSLMEMEKTAFSAKHGDEAIVEEVASTFDSAIGRVDCISKIHELLAHDKVRNNFCDISTIVNSVCEFYMDSVKLNLKVESIFVPYSKAVSIALVVNEVISNSLKHNSTASGQLKIDVTVKKSEDGQAVILICRDHGRGFPSDKMSGDMVQSEGVGIMVMEFIVNLELEGDIKMYNDGGAVVEIALPMKSLLPIEKREVDI